MGSNLYLIPHSTQGNSEPLACFDLSLHLKQHLPKLDGLFAESAAGGRRLLKSLGLTLPILVIDKKTSLRQILADLQAAKGQNWAYASDCGYPCIADPGSLLIQHARALGFAVHLMPGTSAVLAAIALSGLSYERFSFQGYLPRSDENRAIAIEYFENQSQSSPILGAGACLQVFIETPYRHVALLKALICVLKPDTTLCVASEIGNCEQCVRSFSVFQWRRLFNEHSEGERVAVYMILAQKAIIGENSRKHDERGGGCKTKQR